MPPVNPPRIALAFRGTAASFKAWLSDTLTIPIHPGTRAVVYGPAFTAVLTDFNDVRVYRPGNFQIAVYREDEHGDVRVNCDPGRGSVDGELSAIRSLLKTRHE